MPPDPVTTVEPDVDGPPAGTMAGRALRALRSTRTGTPDASAEQVDVEDDVQPDVQTVDELDAIVAADTEEAGEAETAIAPARRRWGLRAALVVALLAVAYLVVAIVVHARAGGGNDTSTSARDDALTAARIDIATLNTLDYRDVSGGLQKWMAVTTGGFHDQISSQAKADASVIAQAKRITTGTVVAAAVTDLDTARGTATVIAAVDVRRTPEGATSTVSRNRYRATMLRDHGVWKIADLSQVAVSLS